MGHGYLRPERHQHVPELHHLDAATTRGRRAPTQAHADLHSRSTTPQDFPACGGTGELACQSDGYPTFCTNAGASITLNGSTNGDAAVANNIYCASGTGNPVDAEHLERLDHDRPERQRTPCTTRFVGGTITFTAAVTTRSPRAGTRPAATPLRDCTSSVPAPVRPAITRSSMPPAPARSALNLNVSGSQTLNGDLFAPNGTANLNLSGNKTLTTFIEGLDISANVSGTMLGDGPTAGTSGTTRRAAPTIWSSRGRSPGHQRPAVRPVALSPARRPTRRSPAATSQLGPPTASVRAARAPADRAGGAPLTGW